MIKESPYEVLGLDGIFEFKDIKKAYRRAIRDNPPEQNPKEFAKISDAYDTLTNDEYFTKDSNNSLYALEVKIELEQEEIFEKSKYLKNSFEVPFQV